jgi:hypothetical protein
MQCKIIVVNNYDLSWMINEEMSSPRFINIKHKFQICNKQYHPQLNTIFFTTLLFSPGFLVCSNHIIMSCHHFFMFSSYFSIFITVHTVNNELNVWDRWTIKSNGKRNKFKETMAVGHFCKILHCYILKEHTLTYTSYQDDKFWAQFENVSSDSLLKLSQNLLNILTTKH